MPEWITNDDGLILASQQRHMSNPSAFVVASAQKLGIKQDSGFSSQAQAKAQARVQWTGALVRLARGVYLDCPSWDAMTPAQRFLAMAKAEVERNSAAIVTGEAAAALHGLPLLYRKATIPLANISRRQGRSDSASHRQGIDPAGAKTLVRRVGKRIFEQHIVEIAGRRVTDVPKTVVDICRSKASENGIVVADAALRQWCSREELRAVLAAYARSPGNRRARDIIAMAGDRSESIGESLTKSCVIRSGIAGLGDGSSRLLQQIDFYDSEGFVGRVDFYLPELNLVIEFDGVIKYSGCAAGATEDILVRERAREKRLQNLGLDVVRLQWGDVINGRCIPDLRRIAEQQKTRIIGGGRTFSSEFGRWEEPDLPYAVREARQKAIAARAARVAKTDGAGS